MKKGFTLIELLAVIVILAIIALIAVPIILDVVNKSKENSYKRSIELYGSAVEQAIARYAVNNNSNLVSGLYISSNSGKTLTKNNVELDIEYTGSKVECDVIIDKTWKLYMNNCYVDETSVEYTYGNINSYITLIGGNLGEIGSKYLVKVNDKDIFDFYLLSSNNDGTVNLIMDRNICSSNDPDINGTPAISDRKCQIAWYDDGEDPKVYNNDINRYGPIIPMQYLYNATKGWSNVSKINLEYDNILDQVEAGFDGTTTYGYKGISIVNGVATITDKSETSTTIVGTNIEPLRARLPLYSEVINAGCIFGSENISSCPDWMTINLTPDTEFGNYQDNRHIKGIIGYWLLSANPANPALAYEVEFRGFLGHYYTSYEKYYGVRPVITVLEESLAG